MTINISGQVPGKDHNGMYDLEEDWSKVAEPDAVYAVVKIERDGLTLKADGTRKPVMKFTAIEPVYEDHEQLVQEILERAAALREGTPLDIPPVPEEPVVDLDTELADKDPGVES